MNPLRNLQGAEEKKKPVVRYRLRGRREEGEGGRRRRLWEEEEEVGFGGVLIISVRQEIDIRGVLLSFIENGYRLSL